MADDSLDVKEPFDYHPCDSPRGMLYYDLSLLTADQQTHLNDFKRNLIRENEMYLARHPEVRAVVALLTRFILQRRPRSGLQEFIGCFFSRPKPDLEAEIREYIQAREPHIYESDSAVIVREESSEESGETSAKEEEEEELEDLADVPRQVLDEILQKAYTRLGIDVDDTGDWVPPDLAELTGESVINEIVLESLKGSREELGEVTSYMEEDLSQLSEMEAPASDATIQTYLEIVPEESAKQAVEEPTEVAQAAAIVEEPAEVIEETKEVVQEPAEVVQEQPEVGQEPTEVVQGPTEVAQEPTEVVQEPTEVVQEPMEAVQEPTEAVQEPTEVVQESAEVVQETEPAGGVEEAHQDVPEEPKTEAAEELKETDVEQPAPEAGVEEAVVAADQPQLEESQ